MALLICAPDRSNEQLALDLRRLLPDVEVRIWPELGNPADIDFAVLWKHPPGLITQLPNLRAISSLGAGIEHLIKDTDIPQDLPIGRLAGPRLATDMANWLVGRVISHWWNFSRFDRAQQTKTWSPWAPCTHPHIGILGLGHMGLTAAKAFAHLSFPVSGWSRHAKDHVGIQHHSEHTGLIDVAKKADILVCLLPLTPQTRGIINADLMAKMPENSVLINVGRGAHLIESDLLESLKHHRPGYAILDVFEEEPLPTDHPFWSHPRITVSPHCAALTDPAEAAQLLARSYTAVMTGGAPLGQVNLTQGY